MNDVKTQVTLLAAAAIAATLMLPALPAIAQSTSDTVFRDSQGRTTSTASTDSQGNRTYRDSGGRTIGTGSTDSQGTTTFRDSGGRTTGTITAPRGGRR